ncbi:MAG: DUF3097 family protein, partial [Pseudonocardiaceae bacterium]
MRHRGLPSSSPGGNAGYGPDVLRQPRRRPEVLQRPAETGLVVEDAASGFCGAVLH